MTTTKEVAVEARGLSLEPAAGGFSCSVLLPLAATFPLPRRRCPHCTTPSVINAPNCEWWAATRVFCGRYAEQPDLG